MQSGKTWICNFLAEATESSGGEYHPTQGLGYWNSSQRRRLRERTPFRAEVELWTAVEAEGTLLANLFLCSIVALCTSV